MSFAPSRSPDLPPHPSRGYAREAADGPHTWFLDTRMTVRADAVATGGAFTFLEWAAPTGFGPPLHIHHAEDEAFYLIEGAMDVRCGDDEWSLGPGGFVLLPRGVPHAFLITDGPVLAVQVTAPSGFEDYVAEIGRPATGRDLPEPSVPDVARVTEASNRRGYQIVGPPLGVAR